MRYGWRSRIQHNILNISTISLPSFHSSVYDGTQICDLHVTMLVHDNAITDNHNGTIPNLQLKTLLYALIKIECLMAMGNVCCKCCLYFTRHECQN